MTPIGTRANTKFRVSALANAMIARATSGHVAPYDVVPSGLANDEGAYSWPPGSIDLWPGGVGCLCSPPPGLSPDREEPPTFTLFPLYQGRDRPSPSPLQGEGWGGGGGRRVRSPLLASPLSRGEE